MDFKKSGETTKKEIREKLEKHYMNTYDAKNIERELIIRKSNNCYFFELEGTPPKGFAIYVPQRKLLCLYNAEGKRFKEYYLQKGIIDLN